MCMLRRQCLKGIIGCRMLNGGFLAWLLGGNAASAAGVAQDQDQPTSTTLSGLATAYNQH
jgi:hypothetical protein